MEDLSGDVIDNRLRSKARGVLLGTAVGDALGARFEGKRKVGSGALQRWLSNQGELRWTDDTHMTIGVAQSLIEVGGFDGQHMALTFARNHKLEPWRGYGRGPPRVFRELRRGVPWDQAAKKMFGGEGSYGNGAAMRVAPVAVFTFQDLGATAELARLTATITHTHDLGVEGAVIQALAVALLLNRSSKVHLEPGSILPLLRDRVRSSIFRDQLTRLESLLAAPSVPWAAKQLGTGIAAHEAVPAALFCFLASPQSFEQTIISSISMGGDTDTIASMAGALSGAYLGEDAIPEDWLLRLEARSEIGRLADALLDPATRGLKPWFPSAASQATHIGFGKPIP